MKVIIPMAGLGTRLRPHTHSRPKPLLSVAGKPVLGHILDRLSSLKVDEYIFVVGYLGEQIEAYVSQNYAFPAQFVVQEEPRGQAHAIHLARDLVDRPILIIFVDTIFEADLSGLADASADGLVFVKEVEDPSRFGIALLDEGRVVRFIEKPDEPISHLALIGMYYVRNSALLLRCVEELIRREIRTKEEYFLADAFQLMVEKGAELQPAAVRVWQDCGKPETLLETQRYLLEKEAGPTVEGEDSVIIPPVHLAPSVRLLRSIVGPYVSAADGSVIEDSIVRDSIINEGVEIQNVSLERSLVGAHAALKGVIRQVNVGDFSRVEFGQ
ncbi:MAG: sugar phosphate nucleotidyltransferase [Anaerolineae bacterium]